MASVGGENPYEVSYNKEQADKISEVEADANMNDPAAGGGGQATKSFSFWRVDFTRQKSFNYDYWLIYSEHTRSVKSPHL